MKIAHSLAIALSTVGAPVALCGATLASASFSAHAQQVKAVDGYWAVVEKAAVMHCGDSQRYYRIAELQPGSLVRVDGESADWARIAYPAGIGAFVRAESVKQGEQPDALVLSAPSRLYAANAIAGLDGSWKALLAEGQALPAGATLKALETVRNQSGAVTGYKVAAPDSARGFVLRTNLRMATPAELANAGVASTPAPQPNDAAATPAPAATDAGTSTPAQPAPITLTESPTGTGTPPPVPTPAPEVTTSDAGEGPVVIEQQPITPVTPPPAPVGSLQALDEAFKRVQSQSDAEAEIDELVAELESALSKLDDTPTNRYARAGLQQRIQILKLRADWRDKVRAMEERRAAATVASGTTQRTLQTLQQNRVYNITGKLTTSELYDGTRLPRMLRVQSVGGPTTRTLGYIKPDPALALDTKIGQTVGVVGNIILDPATGLRTIEALRVEVLANVPTDTRLPGDN